MMTNEEENYLRQKWGNEGHYYTDEEERGAADAVQQLLAEVDALRPDAELGKAVLRMGPDMRLAHYPKCGSPLRWYIETWGWKALGIGDTLRDALADAGLMEVGEDDKG